MAPKSAQMAWTVRRATAGDIPAIAALFTRAFADSVEHNLGQQPQPAAMSDVFTLVYEAEPAAALVAACPDGMIAGYCFAPSRLSGLWLRAVTGGYVFRWAYRWLGGQYGTFGWHSIALLVRNKLAFLQSALQPGQAADARILSIAVDEPFRGQGAAGALMAAAVEYFSSRRVRKVRLEVRPANAPAVRLYEKWGFVPGGVTRDSQGEWLIMFKEWKTRHG